MSKLRLWILIVGPLPIFAASVALTDWARSPSGGPAASNRVLAAERHVVMRPVAAARRVGAKPNAPAGKAATASLAVACDEAAEKMRPKLGPSCHVIVSSPMIVGGDLAEADLEHWHRRTIAPAMAALTNQFFDQQPNRPVTVLLFSGETSYTHFARTVLGDEAISVYGYYKPRQRLLVMNIATGGGTLVHELTHALMAFDFPRVPDWFNEGLASLYEQCQFGKDDNGPTIEGLENWRLPALQQAIRKGRLRPLRALIESDDFRAAGEGMNYAHARYFCMYMQERGLLEKYYRSFRDSADRDPLGTRAALALFAPKTWDDVDQDYRRWVLTLKF